MPVRHYDYIFAGGGLAAMMVLLELQHAGMLDFKTVLIIDPDRRDTNDRTWCYWEAGPGKFDSITHRQWDSAYFISADATRKMPLEPYRYKMVRGADFFAYSREKLQGEKIEHLRERVTFCRGSGAGAEVTTEAGSFTCGMLFNSVFDEKKVEASPFQYLRQHFIGWTVKTDHPVFDKTCPTFMDFSIEQKGNTRFMYVLPFSATQALVEYTLFSKDLLPEREYESAIDDYLKGLNCGNYSIIDKERGSIPMTCYPFHKQNSKNIAFIGSAGGWTKASTGYTFAVSMKKSRELVGALKMGRSSAGIRPYKKFAFYDRLFIDVLSRENGRGGAIFSALFEKGDPAKIFRFLDEETSIFEDLDVLLRCPKIPFLKALWRYIAR